MVTKGWCNLLDLERGQETIVDAFLERQQKHWLAKIGVDVGVVCALGHIDIGLSAALPQRLNTHLERLHPVFDKTHFCFSPVPDSTNDAIWEASFEAPDSCLLNIACNNET